MLWVTVNRELPMDKTRYGINVYNTQFKHIDCMLLIFWSLITKLFLHSFIHLFLYGRNECYRQDAIRTENKFD